MGRQLERILWALRPAFGREATFAWFVTAFAGAVMRQDFYGVSSIVRALSLAPICYPALLHFFHSAAWSAKRLYLVWAQWLVRQPVVARAAGRAVLLGDHTKQPKEGRRMPEVTALHQDSETSSKPCFFRGHQWACMSLLGQAQGKHFALPIWAEIHPDSLSQSRAVRLVNVAVEFASLWGESLFLVLDAFFAVGPVFVAAAASGGALHIITRAKKNIVAHLPAQPSEPCRRGRRRIYGRKLKLMSLFETRPEQFQTAETVLYHKREPVRYLALELFWKPCKGLVRFILVESSHGRMILMCSDLRLEPLEVLRLYTSRVNIESLFSRLKHLLGGMAYHFWSKYLAPVSRRSRRAVKPEACAERPERIAATLEAIEKFMALHLTVLGSLQLLAAVCPAEVLQYAGCWLRTPGAQLPSEFVGRIALRNMLQGYLSDFVKNRITAIIRRKQKPSPKNRDFLLAKNSKVA